MRLGNSARCAVSTTIPAKFAPLATSTAATTLCRRGSQWSCSQAVRKSTGCVACSADRRVQMSGSNDEYTMRRSRACLATTSMMGPSMRFSSAVDVISLLGVVILTSTSKPTCSGSPSNSSASVGISSSTAQFHAPRCSCHASPSPRVFRTTSVGVAEPQSALNCASVSSEIEAERWSAGSPHSIRSSWKTTGTPSAVTWTSNSTKVTPAATDSRNEARVFSRKRRLWPWCACSKFSPIPLCPPTSSLWGPIPLPSSRERPAGVAMLTAEADISSNADLRVVLSWRGDIRSLCRGRLVAVAVAGRAAAPDERRRVRRNRVRIGWQETM
mmetsp:Transcript_11319/g.28564  ORF Transcript_11319/g.28564 Transcript_11319/m.28564 type:complete len:328 (+) Transcript_11319:412-1395(+)